MDSYYRARRKKSSSKRNFTGLALVASGAALFLGALAPSLTGRFGAALHGAFFTFAGTASLLLPLFMGWAGLQQFLNEKSSRLKEAASFAVLFLSLPCF